MQPYNYCHFRPMEYRAGESDCSDFSFDFPAWLECSVCGHTKPVEPPAMTTPTANGESE